MGRAFPAEEQLPSTCHCVTLGRRGNGAHVEVFHIGAFNTGGECIELDPEIVLVTKSASCVCHLRSENTPAMPPSRITPRSSSREVGIRLPSQKRVKGTTGGPRHRHRHGSPLPPATSAPPGSTQSKRGWAGRHSAGLRAPDHAPGGVARLRDSESRRPTRNPAPRLLRLMFLFVSPFGLKGEFVSVCEVEVSDFWQGSRKKP